MALDPNDEILQDLLVSSREILEALDKQLVELEQRPDDKDLLNAVFRGFHTIKGGASFLALTSLVAICHRGEDVFNLLRRGERTVTPQLMDVVLRVLDSVNEMFVHLNNGVEPPPADPVLLAQLEALAKDGPAPVPASAPVVAAAPAAKGAATSGDITDDEFESLLDALASGGSAPAKPVAPAAMAAAPAEQKADTGEISDAEFEALLDQLQGSNPSSAATASAVETPANKPEVTPVPAAVTPAPATPTPAETRPRAAAAPEAAAPAPTPRPRCAWIRSAWMKS